MFVPTRREFLLAGLAAAHSTRFARALEARSGQAAVGQAKDLATLTLKQASELLRRKEASPLELTQACLARIDRHNKAINAFITVTREPALAAARELEAELRRGVRRSPLHGIPIALKDNIDTAGIRTTAASGVFKDRVPSEDADVVTRLKKAGAIIVGKLNLHEFALGGTSAVTYFGPVHNPWALERVGPMCKTVEDAALMLGAIAGYDPGEPTSVVAPVPDYTRAIGAPTGKLRVGVARTPFFDQLNPEVAKAMEAATGVLRTLTARVVDVQVPDGGNIATVWNPEIYAYHQPWITKTPELYQEATRNLIQAAAKANAATYAQARHQVDVLRREIRKVFNTVDVLITPTQRNVAQPIAGSPQPGGAGGLYNTAAFDIFGLPTISVPCGFTGSGLPIGLQISGNHFAEMTVLALAHAYEQATDWHRRRPSLSY
jgi:aspartyl-tRNA(Asn)/glutamyl-tRNA(Gln) amidotransferase subunit A